ncbi:ABC transporter ATP-binding protein [Streptococcus oricebi]|uniref:Glycine/betaine ABC transporter ATP-binding protein n=1 Tax=Streptococcus oricebi TaxID=1547447 RepID=A0ABS5B2L6_9STRE|nr:ABC transporter ATP-binding protein [Streptococcus oricebi]MBP2623047.1 glycine/betaine ABC transporter ATP-binding protein [Streptococcus oricebi]
MITFEKVSKNYGDNQVLAPLSLTIEDGEFFVLVGPSGSGKTTLLKMLNRLIEPSEGQILLDNQELKQEDLRNLRLNTGYVLQQIALFPNLTVQENITLIPELKGWTKDKRVAEAKLLLEQVGLEPAKYLHRYPRELSGGEQQRIGILRAIIAQPRVLLMDEPFSALDPISRRQLQDLTKDLHQKLGLTIVFVTHDMKEALTLADRICILSQGQMIQCDKPDAIKEAPKNAFVESLFEGEEVR